MHENLINTLVEHEGIRRFVYNDSLGNPTIGIGRCISEKGSGLTFDECFYLLRNDIEEANRTLQIYSWYKAMDDVRKEVMIELVFNLGIGNLLKFKKALRALEDKNYSQAAKEFKNSLWANQVGPKRVNNICNRLVSGRYA